MSDELNLPWKIYVFNEDGTYDPTLHVMYVYSTEEMQTSRVLDRIKSANDLKREIRVCDCLDYCIIHWKDGERIFPK